MNCILYLKSRLTCAKLYLVAGGMPHVISSAVLFCLFLSGGVVAQAPGNTGQIPLLWLRADKDVTLSGGKVTHWLDQSGKGNHHYQDTLAYQPGYDETLANFNPTTIYNGGQYIRDITGILDTTKTYTEAHVFFVHNSATPVADRGMYGQYVKLTGPDAGGRYMGHGEFNGTQYFGIKSGQNDWVQLPSGSARMNAYVINTFRVKNAKQDLWFNGGDNFEGNFVHSGYKSDKILAWSVGAAPEGQVAGKRPHGFKHKGQVAEVLVFENALTEANRYKVESYLGIKYGATLLHNYVTSDYNGSSSSVNIVYDISTYGNNIAGIARDDDFGLYQRQSRSQNSVQYANMVTMGATSIATSNALNGAVMTNNMYLVWGDDGASINEKDGGEPGQKILGRTWKLQATGQSANSALRTKTDVQFNLSGITLSKRSYGTMKLIIDRDGDGDFSKTAPDAISVYYADPSSVESAVLFQDVSWDTDNNGVDLFRIGLQYIDVSPGRLCIGDSTTVTYEAVVDLAAGNGITLELSDANGNFANTVSMVNKMTVALKDSLRLFVPASTPPGSGYKMRLMSTVPSFTTTSTVALGYCPANTGKVPALWLRADKDLTVVGGKATNWLDQSGNSNHHSQDTLAYQPGVNDTIANFNPTTTYNGVQYIRDPNGILDSNKVYTEAQVFLIHNSSTPHANRGLYGQYAKFKGPDAGGRYMGHGEFNGTQYFGIKSGNNDWVQLPSGSDRMNAYVINTFRLANGTQELWFNGGDNFQANFLHSSYTSAGKVPWSVGAAPLGTVVAKQPYGYKQKGQIPEIIVYDEALSEANRFKLESYLGIKYGATLLHNYVSADYTGSPSTANVVYNISTYGNNIAGIARDDAFGLYQRQSRSQNSVQFANMVTMGADTIAVSNQTNGATLKDKSYLVWGDDGATISEVDASIPGQKLLSRIWKMQATGQEADTSLRTRTDVRFNMTGVPLMFPAYPGMKLLIDRDGDGDFSNVSPERVDTIEASDFSTISNVLFDNVLWDTDNNGVDMFRLFTLSYVPPKIDTNQYICRNTMPDTLRITKQAVGVSNEAVYQWQISDDSINWSDIGVANSSDRFQPGRLAETSWFRVITKDQGREYAPSNVIKMTVVPDIPLSIGVTSLVQPTCNPPEGCTLQLNNLPNTTWTLFQDGVVLGTYSDNTNTYTIRDLPDGAYRFYVASQAGCYTTPPFGVIVVTY